MSAGEALHDVTRAHTLGGTRRLIEPGTPNQHAYIESCNSRVRDEGFNEHWVTSLAHAQTGTEAWRREFTRPLVQTNTLDLPVSTQLLRLSLTCVGPPIASIGCT